MERTALLEEIDDLVSIPDSDMTEQQVGEKALRMSLINTRLETIDAQNAESKAS